MMIVAVNTGWNTFTQNMIVFYNRNRLKLSGAENAAFTSLTFIPFNIKPIWGFLSDTFYIFGYR